MFWHYLILATTACIKFMFAPLYGKAVGLNFFETYFSLLSGGLLAAFIFYKLTYRILERNRQKKIQKRVLAMDMGFEYFEPKKFTRTNKFIVKTRRKFGFFICAFFFPFFLSVPLGTIVSTKFYGKKPMFLPVVVLGLLVNGFIITSLVYLL